MKRFINIYSIALSALLLLAGCTVEPLPGDEEAVSGPHVKLTVSLPGAATKAGTAPTIHYEYKEISESEVPADIKSGLTDSGTLPAATSDSPEYVKVGTKYYKKVAVRIEGEDNWNENKVTSVYYFFYKDGSDTDAPKMSGHFAGLSLSGEGATKTWTIPASADVIANQLFPSGVRECQTFVIANPPASLITTLDSQEKTITLKALRELSFSTSLIGKQDSFVMVWDGKSEVGSRTGDTAMDVDAKLRRIANKITVKVNVAPEYYDKEGGWKYWEPKMETLSVEFFNGMSKANLCGDFSKLSVSADTDYFTSDASSFGTVTGIDKYFYMEVSQAVAEAAAGTSGVTTLTTMPSSVDDESPVAIKVGDLYYKLEQYQQASSTTPLYTYPMTWEYASATEPFLMFSLQWENVYKDAGGANHRVPQTCYYKLMLSQKSITTNGWYDITADLKVLGSFDKFAPTQQYLHEDYVVLEWINAFEFSENNVDAEIKDARYLVVPQKEWTVNNRTSVSIPFTSSHPCEVVNKKITALSYSSGTQGTKNPYYTEVGYDLSQPNRLTVIHELNNTLGADMDCTLITIEFDIKHTDNGDFKEHVKIVQKPAITIETIANSGGRSSDTGYGYTWVNGARSNSSASSTDWRKVLGANSGTGDNSSIYFTIISVSQFDSSSGYIVGDPRTAEIDNLDTKSNTDGVQWNTFDPASAPVLYTGDGQTGNRTIKYYYPTVDDGSRDNYIAPSIRVNSANCRSGQNETYENAKQRCAAYQEDGYPAGRWRLPTLAECKLIQTMSRTSIIPTIFIQGATSYYCYAGGWFAGNASSDSDYHPYNPTTGTSYSKTTSTGGSGGGAARCVYDEWYWSVVDGAAGKADTWRPISDKTVFTWGDQPR